NVGTDRSGGNGVANGFHDRQAMRLSDLLSKLAAAPIATMLQLRDFTTGISYLLGQVDLLAKRLRTHNSFHPRQRTLAIQICGKNPRDLFTDCSENKAVTTASVLLRSQQAPDHNPA